MKDSVLSFVAGLVAGGLLVVVAIPRFNGSAPKKAGFYEKNEWQAKPGPVRVAGVMINGVTKRAKTVKDARGFAQQDELAFQGTFAKSRVALQLRGFEGGKIVDLDREASKLTRWRDSRGTQILEENALGGPFEFFARVAEQRDSLVCSLQSKNLPHASATHFEVEGELALRVADKRGSWESESLPIEKGTKLEAGAFRIEVVGVSQENGKPLLQVQLEQDPSTIDAWELIDTQGEAHELKRRMSMSGGGTWRLSFACDDALPESARLRLRGWDGARSVRVPFAVRAGFGVR